MYRNSENWHSENGIQEIQSHFNDTDADSISQKTLHDLRVTNYIYNFSYVNPISESTYLEIAYNYDLKLAKSSRDYFSVFDNTDILSDSLSYLYVNRSSIHGARLNFQIARRKYLLNFGTVYQNGYLDGKNKVLSEVTTNSYSYLLPNFSFRYNARDFRVDSKYVTHIQLPNIQYLQPIIDNRDPFNIVLGNTRLKPSYHHNYLIQFSSENKKKSVSNLTKLNIELIRNAIANSQTIDDRLVRTIQPLNMDSFWNIQMQTTVGIPIPKIESRVQVFSSIGKRKSISVTNGFRINAYHTSFDVGTEVFYDLGEYFGLNLSADIHRESISYSYETNLNQVSNYESFSLSAKINPLARFHVDMTGNYYLYHTNAMNQRQIPILNFNLSYLLFNQKGELGVSMINVLNQRSGTAQRTDMYFFERIITNAPGRFFMLTFNYALRARRTE